MFDLLSLSRRAYNLTIEHFKTTEYVDQQKLVPLRREIKEICKIEFTERTYRAEAAGESVRRAFKTKQAIIKNRKKGMKCDYKFKSIKEPNQSFIEQRLNKSFMKKFHVTEQIPEDAYGRTTTISFVNGRWYVCCISNMEIAGGADNQGLTLCAIDPGVRTFATTYSLDNAHKIGDGFFKDKIFPLVYKLDKLYSERQLYLNTKPNKETQAFDDTMRFFAKRASKIKNRIDDLISDLHRRTAHWLVTTYDVILLPAFETQNMVKKQNRKIRKSTVRALLGLRQYQFQEMMKWMCKKYGKTLIICNEAYTSKTQSWNGVVQAKLGGKKTIGKEIVVDRDINGARGILLRALTAASAEDRSNNVAFVAV